MQTNTFQTTTFKQGLLFHILPGIPENSSSKRVSQEKLEGPLCKISCMSFLAFQNMNIPDSAIYSSMIDYLNKVKPLGQIKCDYDGFINLLKENMRVNNFQPVKETELMVCNAMVGNGKKTNTVSSNTIKITEDLVSKYKKSNDQNIKEFSEKYWISQKLKCEMDFLKSVDVSITEKYEKFKHKVYG